jgi:hypothetical protein
MTDIIASALGQQVADAGNGHKINDSTPQNASVAGRANAPSGVVLSQADNEPQPCWTPKNWDDLELFLREIMGPWWPSVVGTKIWTTAFPDVSQASWFGAPGLDWMRSRWGDEPVASGGLDMYFCIGVLGPRAKNRTLVNVVAQPLLIVDDIGTKVPFAKWEELFRAGCPLPTFRIETSPGNETWGWSADGNAVGEDRWQDMALLRAWLVEKGLTDAVMDPTRNIRLPSGWNSKPKYRPDGAGLDQSPRVRLVEWRPPSEFGRVDLDALGAAVLGRPDWREAGLPTSAAAQSALTSAQITSASNRVRSADLAKPEPIMRLAQELGRALTQVRAGVVEMPCPNEAQHTTRDGTGFAFIGDGIMCCQHAHCRGLSPSDFRNMLCQEYDEQFGEEGAGVHFLAVETFRDLGGFADVAAVQAQADNMAARGAAANAARAQASAATNAAAITASPFAPIGPIAPRQIPPRKWLYGYTAIAGFPSFLVAPGGYGKSALAMVEAVAMATGLELLPGEKPVRPLRVWMHNAEDDKDEMERRLAAILQHFGLTHADLNGNLFMTSGRDMKLQLARMGRDGPEIVPGVVDAVVERLLSAKIDVLILDPLGALHTLPENSNEAANLLLGAMREVAHRAGVALIVLHHAGKAAAMDMDAAGAGASRGASAFVDGARVVRQLVRMTEKEAGQFGIADADRRDFLRVENGKANLARAENGRWLRMVDVPLGNGAGLWPLGDRVGVVERWSPPAASPGTACDLARVQAAILASPRRPRASQRSPDWIGWLVADALGLDTGGPSVRKEDRTPAQAGALARVRAMVAGWVQSGGLIERQERDEESRKSWSYVFVGQAAVLLGPDGTDADVDAENAE